MAVWFSSALKVSLEVITGASSSRSEMFIVISWVPEFVPSLAVMVAV